MDKWLGRVALVTGSSTGIGAAITSALINHGINVMGCGRSLEKLEEFGSTLGGKGTFTAVHCDVSNEADVKAMFDLAKTKYGGIDLCINNAGLNHNTTLLEGTTEEWKNILDINVLGMSICAREAFRSMKEKGVDDGYIVNIGSISGHVIAPNYHASHMYSASKFAVRALTQGLRNEVKDAGTNIRVTHLSPGIVETQFQYKMRGTEVAKKFYGSIKAIQPDDIADALIYVLSTPAHIEVTELTINTTEKFKAQK